MKIVIAGGTGFVGKHITDFFIQNGHDVFILTRSKKQSSQKQLHFVQWLTDDADPTKALEGADTFINLAGKSINDRWTSETKKQILESRISTTKAMYEIVEKLESKPSVYINASAVGIYGTSLNDTFTEQSTKTGTDFLAETVKKWEAEAEKIQTLGVRTVYTRFGIVLGEGGALPKMVQPYKLYAGGTVGSGNQWISWIHVKDLVRLIEFIIKTETISGPINATTPYPVSMKEFGQTIGQFLGRPHWIPAPAFALKAMLGEMSILVLEGQKVIPAKALENDFNFSYSHLDEALSNILK
ncbi:TIGR01777 family oxidoreductase [Metabacillus herbersteinensis]|uniref:TIGR01777 family oxidoreductase n=1 Tax=Metabacillus herbersteinensis TaxID=283816 RepID=A0ABV6GJF6_9BACI